VGHRHNQDGDDDRRDPAAGVANRNRLDLVGRFRSLYLRSRAGLSGHASSVG
jgi:hypothetical protein